tara:strand:+ start:5396 stop:5677 length:282 start_codon:yes stop_codon:yes gene_type:complete
MVLHKQVNGKRVKLTKKEEKEVRDEWAKNDLESKAGEEIASLIKQVPSIEERLEAIELFIIGLDPEDMKLIDIKKYTDLYPEIKAKKEAMKNG